MCVLAKTILMNWSQICASTILLCRLKDAFLKFNQKITSKPTKKVYLGKIVKITAFGNYFHMEIRDIYMRQNKISRALSKLIEGKYLMNIVR